MGILLSKTCANCGRKFFTRDRNKIYCDVKCEDYAKDGIKVEYTETEQKEQEKVVYKKTCPNCFREFTKRPHESYSGFTKRKCCSGVCGQQYRVKMERRNK